MQYTVSGLIHFLFLALPFTGMIKVLTGISYFSLIFDLALFGTILICFAQRPSFVLRFEAVVMTALIVVSVLQIFNPYDSDLMFKVKGYRSSGLYMLAFFVPWMQQRPEQNLERFIRLNLIVGCVVMLYAIRQLILPLPIEKAYAQMAGTGSTFMGDTYERDANVFRIFGTFSASTHLAAYCVWIFSVAGAAYLMRLFRPALPVAALALSIVGLAITYSRTTLVALPVAALVLAFGYGRLRSGLKGIMVTVALGIVGSIFLAAAAAVVPMLKDRLMTIVSFDNVSSLMSRLLIWQERLHDIAQAPWGYGTGLAGFHDIENQKLVADNQFLKVLIEWGWLAGASFIIMLICIAIRQIRTITPQRPRVVVTVQMASASFVAAMLLVMMTGQILEAFPIGVMFWYLCGLGYYLAVQPLHTLAPKVPMNEYAKSPTLALPNSHPKPV